MVIKSLSYKRIRNLGNYETSSLEGSVELDPGENPHIAYNRLKSFIHFKLELISAEEFKKVEDTKEIF